VGCGGRAVVIGHSEEKKKKSEEDMQTVYGDI